MLGVVIALTLFFISCCLMLFGMKLMDLFDCGKGACCAVISIIIGLLGIAVLICPAVMLIHTEETIEYNHVSSTDYHTYFCTEDSVPSTKHTFRSDNILVIETMENTSDTTIVEHVQYNKPLYPEKIYRFLYGRSSCETGDYSYEIYVNTDN